jgi:hypothetical protein
MNALSSLNSSYFSPQKAGQLAHANQAARSSLLSQQQTSSPLYENNNVSLSDTGLALSKRASELGSATADAAKNFLSSFVQELFGSDSVGLQISFDSASISASSQFFAALEYSTGPDGSRDAAAIGLRDVANFIGKGQITTADGHRYNFEVEVHYESIVQSSTVTSTSNLNANNSDAPTTAPKQQAQHFHGLNAHFPGSVRDLFSLFSNGKFEALFQFPSRDEANTHQQDGKLKFHLLDLVDSLVPNVKKLNDAYGKASSLEPTAKTI